MRVVSIGEVGRLEVEVVRRGWELCGHVRSRSGLSGECRVYTEHTRFFAGFDAR
jgi:hypothetical protein